MGKQIIPGSQTIAPGAREGRVWEGPHYSSLWLPKSLLPTPLLPVCTVNRLAGLPVLVLPEPRPWTRPLGKPLSSEAPQFCLFPFAVLVGAQALIREVDPQ